MDEVKSLASLRALILNDNEIRSVCKLDQMKELNTLVLSRNPIRSLGESVAKLKSITKLSLSNCQLQKVDSSLKSCQELKELRLAHNEIMTIPSEFGHLVKLQNLDMGNNSIINWSDLKVLSSLVNLRNLNLQGNPITEKENLLKKVKKLLPNLHIFNGRPIDKIATKDVHGKADDFSVEAGSRSKRKELWGEKDVGSAENANTPEKKKKKKLKAQQEEPGITDYAGAVGVNPEEEKKSKHKKEKKSQVANKPDVKWETVGKVKEADKKSSKNLKGDKVNIFDSAESPFMDLFLTGEVFLEAADSKLDHKTDKAIDANSGVITHPTKKKKKNRAVDPSALELSQVDEIGLGGPSAWDI
ncbi:hypothetical protein ACS0TY_026784 [Phlomoides rotata]